MNNIIEQQNQFLTTTKQRIIANLNDIYKVLELDTDQDDDSDMVENGIALMVLLLKHKDHAFNDNIALWD
jgi:hypothetical protein